MFASNRVLIPIGKPKKKSSDSKRHKNAKSKKKSRQKKRSKNQSSNFSLSFTTEKIPQYNSLLDKHLVNYFSNPNIDFMLSFDESKKPKPLKRHSYQNVMKKTKAADLVMEHRARVANNSVSIRDNEKEAALTAQQKSLIKKSRKELKKVIAFIEKENDKVRLRKHETHFMNEKEKLKWKRKEKRKQRMRSLFFGMPVWIRSHILTFMELKESLELVQIFACQTCQDTWRMFISTYYKMMVYPIFESDHQLKEDADSTSTTANVTQYSSSASINYYQLFKSLYYTKKSSNKYYTAIRLRPFILKEYERCFTKMPEVPQEDDGKKSSPKVVVEHPVNGRKHAFQGFNTTFWSHSARLSYADQGAVFTEMGSHILTPLWMGNNVTLFAYGTSKSGKTYQIYGTESQPGLLPRCAETIFSSIAFNEHPDVEVSVHVSMVELSGGHIVDMFDTTGAYLELINDPVNGAYVDGLKVLPVGSFEEMKKIVELQRGENRSALDTTKRHTIFQLSLMQTLYAPGSDEIKREKVSTLSFVDLGACEQGDEEEAFGIGHDLTTLHEVVACMRQKSAQKKEKKKRKKAAKKGSKQKKGDKLQPIAVPFRMSPLTCLLKQGLEKSARVFFIGCLAPSEYSESIKTLEYISSLKDVGKPYAVLNGAGSGRSRTVTPSASRHSSPPRNSAHSQVEEHHPRGQKGASNRSRARPKDSSTRRAASRRTHTVQDYHRAGGPLASVRSHHRHRAGIPAKHGTSTRSRTALGTMRQNKTYVSLKRMSEPVVGMSNKSGGGGGFLPQIGGARNNLVTR